MTSPVRSRTSSSWPASLSSSQRSAVRRSCQTSARWTGSPVSRVPGDDGLALVGDPDRVEVGALDPGVGDRLRGDPPRHLPDLGRVVLDPAGAREVLLELAVGAAGDPALAVEDEAGGAGRPLVDREDHGREAMLPPGSR